MRITSLDQNGVTLQSLPFEGTKTGRLAVSIYMRVEIPQQQPNVRLAVSGYWRDREYFRYAKVGEINKIIPLRSEWSQYVLQIDDLPAEGLSPLRLRVDIFRARRMLG